MATVETQAQADQLNRDETFGPYQAANGHLMIAPLLFPRDRDAWNEACKKAEAEDRRDPPFSAFDRDYKIGDQIRYTSASAYCAPGCDHSESGPPPEDW
jgi:hypothetical protein